MDQKQPNLNDVFQSPRAAALLNDRQAVEALLHSDEARQLMDLLNRSSGDSLTQAAHSAMKGDPARLMEMLDGLMKDPQSAQLVERLNQKAPK